MYMKHIKLSDDDGESTDRTTTFFCGYHAASSVAG